MADNLSITESRLSVSDMPPTDGRLTPPKEHQQDFFRLLKHFRKYWKAQEVSPQMKKNAHDYHNIHSLDEVVRSVRRKIRRNIFDNNSIGDTTPTKTRC